MIRSLERGFFMNHSKTSYLGLLNDHIEVPMTQTYEPTRDFAHKLDQADPLSSYRDRFYLPLLADGSPYYYFTGNSLGCQPKSLRSYLETEVLSWEKLAVEGHFHGKNPWLPYHEFLTPAMARIVGAKEEEVIMMNSLTVNLHLMMVSFYRPTASRNKILIEADAFPSDIYAVSSQIAFHGYDPKDSLIMLRPRQGEHALRTEDILQTIEEEGDSIAMVMFGGVNYYTGQVFEFEKIVKAGQAKGCVVGFDLAHTAGNIPLKLHDWNVDFACWCSYKYLNGGPGGVAGAFVHERHMADESLPRFAGWWGHDKATRFKMEPDFVPIPTAEGWQLSNAPVLSMAALKASLDIFDEVGMEALREKSKKLTGYMHYLLTESRLPLTIITPADPLQRGCQLSIMMHHHGKAIFDQLEPNGVICDWREPNVIRLAPVPLYNNFMDAFEFVEILKKLLKA